MTKLDVTKLKVGDVFYGVKDTNNLYHRKKVHQTIDGEDWFKYEIPRVTYEPVTYTVLGILTKIVEGEWEDTDWELLPEIFMDMALESGTNSRFTMYIDDMESKTYFIDKVDALSYIDSMKEKDKEIDRI